VIKIKGLISYKNNYKIEESNPNNPNDIID
jgi:hypothetical protein